MSRQRLHVINASDVRTTETRVACWFVSRRTVLGDMWTWSTDATSVLPCETRVTVDRAGRCPVHRQRWRETVWPTGLCGRWRLQSYLAYRSFQPGTDSFQYINHICARGCLKWNFQWNLTNFAKYFNHFTAEPVKALHFAIRYWSNPSFLISDIRALWN